MPLDSVWDKEVNEDLDNLNENVEDSFSEEYEELCSECDGSGEQHEMMEYDDEESWAGVCAACNGSGKATKTS